MPVFVGVAAAMAASYAGSAVVGYFALSGFAAVAVGAAVGAVVGAAVGAVGTAITGGDIGQGALYGAIGGAIAGGFGGYFSGMENSMANASVPMKNVAPYQAGGGGGGGGASWIDKALGSGGSEAAGMGMKEVMAGQLMAGIGDYVTAGKEMDFQKEMYDKQVLENEETLQKTNEQRLKEIMESHSARMEEIGLQGASQRDIAADNNTAAMDRLNTEIEARRAEVAAANEREDEKIKGFNDSVMGTDIDNFQRPKLTFDDFVENAISGFQQNFQNTPGSGQQQNTGTDQTGQQQVAATQPPQPTQGLLEKRPEDEQQELAQV